MEKIEGENNSAENRIWSHIEAIKNYSAENTFGWLANFSGHLLAIEDLINAPEMQRKINPSVLESASMKIGILNKDINELKENYKGNGDKPGLREEDRNILISRIDNLFV